VCGDRVDRGEDRLHGRDAARLGAPSTYCAHAGRKVDPELRSRRAKTDEALLPQVQRVGSENLGREAAGDERRLAATKGSVVVASEFIGKPTTKWHLRIAGGRISGGSMTVPSRRIADEA